MQTISRSTILENIPRTLQTNGLGQKKSLYSLNFSHEVLFSRRVNACVERNMHLIYYINIRAPEPISDTYPVQKNIHVECMTERNNYTVSHPVVVFEDWIPVDLSDCKVHFPNNTSVVTGNFAVEKTGCAGTEMELDCYTGTFVTACAAFVYSNDTVAHFPPDRVLPSPNSTWLYIETSFPNKIREMNRLIAVLLQHYMRQQRDITCHRAIPCARPIYDANGSFNALDASGSDRQSPQGGRNEV